MTTTASDLVHETRQHFLGSIRPQFNFLGDAIDADDTAIAVDDSLGPIAAGAVLSIDLERVLVRSVASQANIVVKRGWDGTTAATHSDGATIAVNDRCDNFAVLRAINNELAALSAKGLYRVRDVEFTYNPSTFGNDLASVGTVIGSPLKVRARGTQAGEWVTVPRSSWVYDATADSGDFTSGRSLELIGGYGSSGQSVKVIYRAPFVALATLADDVQAVSFLPATANDILPMGAALQLAQSRPMQRSDLGSQPSSRRAEEVTTQETLMASSGLRARYEQRVNEEATRLLAEHGLAR